MVALSFWVGYTGVSQRWELGQTSNQLITLCVSIEHPAVVGTTWMTGVMEAKALLVALGAAGAARNRCSNESRKLPVHGPRLDPAPTFASDANHKPAITERIER